MNLGDLAAGLISFLLTLMVLSYIIGDNPLFRLTIHLFIGVAAGYAGAVALLDVIIPKLAIPFSQAINDGSFQPLILAIPPALLGLLLLAKLSSGAAWLGNPTMAFLVGVGAAAAIGGSVLGTLFPQVGSTIRLFDLRSAQESGFSGAERLIEGMIILVGTISTLMYFHFGTRARPDMPARRSRYVEIVSWGGGVFIAITFGVLFAGVYTAALTALIERLSFVWDFLAGLL